MFSRAKLFRLKKARFCLKKKPDFVRFCLTFLISEKSQRCSKNARISKSGFKKDKLATLVTTAELGHMHYNIVCDVTNRTVLIISSQWMV